MEHVSLEQVLRRRNKQHCKTQEIHSSSLAVFNSIRDSYMKHFEDFNGTHDGWITSSDGAKEWKNVIYCPDFSPSGEMIYRKRSKTSQMYKILYETIKNGFVHPNLQVCKIIDSTHPIRFATPPDEDCYTAIYTGPEIPPKGDRIIFGEYTGLVLHNSACDQQKFEYIFDLSFNTYAWPYKGNSQVITLPRDGEYILDSSKAFNELSLVNHYQVINLFGNVTMKKNCEWQQIYFDGWPHVILTSIPGVGIKPGEELLADFGNEWFTKVTDISHKLLARELLEYRMGLRTNPVKDQKLTRDISFIDKTIDPLVQIMDDQPCAICNILVKSETIQDNQKSKNHLSQIGDSIPNQVFCDGCDRPFHTSCIKDVLPSFTSLNYSRNNINISLNSGFPSFNDPLDRWYCYYCRRLALDIVETDNRLEISISKRIKFSNYTEKISKKNAKSIPSPFSPSYSDEANKYNDSKNSESVDTMDSDNSSKTKMTSTVSIESALSDYFQGAGNVNYEKEFNSAKYIFGEVFENPFNSFGNRIKVCKQCISYNGELASVFVCRVVKRHLGGNHDHPHNLKSFEIKEMLLEFYQQQIHFYIRLCVLKNIALSYLCQKNERYYKALNDLFKDNIINVKSDVVLKRKKLLNKSTFDSIGGVINEINTVCESNNLLEYINNVISNNWYVKDEFKAALDEESLQGTEYNNEINTLKKSDLNIAKELGFDKIKSKKPIKRFIPLLGVWIGETSILRRFDDGYYYGVITDYNDEVDKYNTVFKISYMDGDEEFLQPEDLATELIGNISSWRGIIRTIKSDGCFDYIDNGIFTMNSRKILNGLMHPRFNLMREL